MRKPGDILRGLGATLLLIVGVVHIQQYADFIKDVPTISELFLLNGVGAGVLCVLLATRQRALAALGGLGLCAGALVSVAIARYAHTGLFDYREPMLRTPVALAILTEIAAVIVLAVYALAQRRQSPQQVPGGALRGRL